FSTNASSALCSALVGFMRHYHDTVSAPASSSSGFTLCTKRARGPLELVDRFTEVLHDLGYEVLRHDEGPFIRASASRRKSPMLKGRWEIVSLRVGVDYQARSDAGWICRGFDIDILGRLSPRDS